MASVADPLPEVDLARTPDFGLGGLAIRPSTCRVSRGDQDQRIEPRVMQVLVVLAQRAEQTVTRDQLVDACWGGRIVSDDAVNRVLAQVRALGRAFDPAPFALETVPKVGVRLHVSDAVGEAARPGRPAMSADRRRLAMAAATVVALAAAAVVGWRLLSPGASPSSQNGRVEVVRFETRQDDPELRRFGAELGDSMVRVLTRSSIDTVPQIVQKGDGSSPAGAELRITGSIDRRGGEVIADVQVVDRGSGLVLDSVHETRPAASLDGFSERLSVGVASALACVLEDRRRSRRAMQPSVLALYLNTCDALTREGNPQRELETARRLAEAAPRLAIAQALYGIAQAHAASYDERPEEEAAALRRAARASAMRALALDPDTPKAYLAIAISYPDGKNFLEREQALLKAHQIDPGLNPGRISYMELLHEVGRVDEAIDVGQQLMDSADPRTGGGAPSPSLILGYASVGRRAEADELLDRLQQLDPKTARGARWLMLSLWGEGESDLRQLRAIGSSGINPKSFACVETHISDLARRKAAHVRGLPEECDRTPPGRRMVLLAREGDIDGAYENAAKLEAAPDAFLGFLYGPQMQAFRADPRFMPMAKRLGLVDYWATTGRWPDFCAEPGLPYDCRKIAASLGRQHMAGG